MPGSYHQVQHGEQKLGMSAWSPFSHWNECRWLRFCAAAWQGLLSQVWIKLDRHLEPTCHAMVTPYGMAEMGKMIMVMTCKRSLHWITQDICMIRVLTSLTKYLNFYHTWDDVHWKVDSGWHDCCLCFFGFQARAYQCQGVNIKTFRKVTVPRLWYDMNPALDPSASQMPSNKLNLSPSITRLLLIKFSHKPNNRRHHASIFTGWVVLFMKSKLNLMCKISGKPLSTQFTSKKLQMVL